MRSINQKSIYDDIFKFQTSMIFPLFVIINTGASLPCASNSLLNKYYLSNYHLETPNNYRGITDSIEPRYINIRQIKILSVERKISYLTIQTWPTIISIIFHRLWWQYLESYLSLYPPGYWQILRIY